MVCHAHRIPAPSTPLKVIVPPLPAARRHGAVGELSQRLSGALEGDCGLMFLYDLVFYVEELHYSQDSATNAGRCESGSAKSIA
jgi:hypothetical protein